MGTEISKDAAPDRGRTVGREENRNAPDPACRSDVQEGIEGETGKRRQSSKHELKV